MRRVFLILAAAAAGYAVGWIVRDERDVTSTAWTWNRMPARRPEIGWSSARTATRSPWFAGWSA